MQKNRKFWLVKKILITSVSSFVVGSLLSYSFSTGVKDTNNLFLTSTTKNAATTDSSTSTSSVTESINSFNDYDLLASSNIIAPVTTTQGVIGMTSDAKSLTLTTFDGILVWNKIFANDSTIIDYYQQNYSSQSVSDLVINNFIYISSIDVIAVLLGTTSNTNQVILGINMTTGTLYDPIASTDGSINNIVKAHDGIKYLYENSNGDIIATDGSNYASYVNSQYITMNNSQGIGSINLVVPQAISEDQNDYLMTIVKGYNGVNFAVFIANSATETDGNYLHNIYITAVNDSLNPIYDTSGNKITLTLSNKYGNLTSPTSLTLDWDDIITYQPGTISTSSSAVSFFIVIPGIDSAINICSYNFSTNALTSSSIYDASSQEESIGFFSYDASSQRLFIANKKSKEGRAAGYFDLSSSLTNNSFVLLESYTQTDNWDSSTYIYTNLIREIPIINDSLTVPNPYILLEEGEEPTAKYFVSETDIQLKPLDFKKYSDPATTFKSNYSSSLQNYASAVSDSNLISSLKFTSTDSSFSPTITIQNKSADDATGTLNFQYLVTYSNWYATSTSSFLIQVTIDGFYTTSALSFSFITGLTGDSTIDQKWNNILELESEKYASEITAQDIIDNFINYDITDDTGQKITITTDMVSLQADETDYSLTVTITLTGNFPSGTTTTFSHTYNGFKTISGYDFSYTADPTNFDKSQIYPSQLTLDTFLTYFVSLGSKWSLSDSDWDFSLTPNNLTGEAVVSLTYKGTNSDFPSQQTRDLVVDETISGFCNIPSQFANKVSMTSVSSSLTPSQLWQEYQTSASTSKLSSSLFFPYVTNINDLEITCNNLDTCDTDGYLDLSISIKTGTTTSLYISGYGSFLYDEDAQTAFESILGSSVFNVKWKVNYVTQSFSWLSANETVIDSDSSTLFIDLSNESYEGITKDMYANEVSEAAIDNLFSASGYTVSIEMNPNVSQGTLTAVLDLKVDETTDSSSESNQTKTVVINGFKIPVPQQMTIVIYTIVGILAFVTLCLMIFVIIYFKRKTFNYRVRKKIRRIKRKK